MMEVLANAIVVIILPDTGHLKSIHWAPQTYTTLYLSFISVWKKEKNNKKMSEGEQKRYGLILSFSRVKAPWPYCPHSSVGKISQRGKNPSEYLK